MDFKKMSLAELRNYAKEMGIRNISTLKKSELTQLLENVEKMTSKRVEVKKTETAAEEKKTVEKKAVEKKPDERRSDERKPDEKRTEGNRSAERKPEDRVSESRKTEARKTEARMSDTAKTEAPAEASRSEKMMTYDGQEYNAELDSGEGYVGWIWVYPKCELSSGRQGHLCFTGSDKKIRSEKGRYYRWSHKNENAGREIQCTALH